MLPTHDPCDHFANETDYPDLDIEGALTHLSAAISCKTVYTTLDDTNFSEFDKLHDLIRSSYPHVMEAGTLEVIGHSVLIIVAGSDPSLPCALLLAHQDVVPVIPGSEQDWVHDAFSGDIDDEWVWGRGALDIKDMLIAELEAVEYLLMRRGSPRRTIVLAFGEDEEVSSLGATALAAVLKERGIHAAFSLDEGLTTYFDGADYGAPGVTLSDICLSQKGYVNLRIIARGHGGHSSNPFGGTSLERVCLAIAKLREACPRPSLVPVVAKMWKELAPYVSEEPFKSLVDDVDAHAGEIAQFASEVRVLFPLVNTTMAANMLEGASSAANVMPKDVCATVNFRLLPGCDVSDLIAWAVCAVSGLGVEVEVSHSTPAGRLYDSSCEGYAALKGVLEHYYRDVVFLPSLVCGGTDSIRYEAICDCALRICPFRPMPEEEDRGVHGVNERISRRVFAQGLRVLVAFLEETVL